MNRRRSRPGWRSTAASLSRHLPFQLVGDARRSIMLPFNMGGHHDLQSVFSYVESLSDQEVVVSLGSLVAEFRNRHSHFEDRLEERYESAARIDGSHGPLSRERRLLIGAYFTMEYSIEAAALFNPSTCAPRSGRRPREDFVSS